MITLYFDVATGDLTIHEGNDSLVFPMLRTSDGNFSSVLLPHAQERMIKKLVKCMTLQEAK